MRIASSVIRAAIMVVLSVAAPSGQGREPVTHEALWLMPRVGQPVLSPDARWVVFSVTQPAYDQDELTSDLWIVPADGSTPPRQLTFTKAGETEVAWSADSRRLAFVTRRDRDEASQIYVLDTTGGEAVRVTSLSTGASSPAWRPDGRAILFTSLVYPGAADDDANKAIAKERQSRKFSVRAYDGFPVRQWNGGLGEWMDDRQPHLFVQDVAPGAIPRDLLVGTELVKHPGFGSATDGTYTSTPRRNQLDAVWAPDGQSIVFVATKERHTAMYATVHPHLFQVPAAGGEPKQLTTGNRTFGDPRFRADGRALYLVVVDDHDQVYAHNRVAVAPWPWSGEPTLVDASFDRSMTSFGSTTDGRSLYTLGDDGRIYGIAPNAPAKLLPGPGRGVYGGLRVASGAAGPVLVATWGSATEPPEIVRIDPATGQHRPLTSFNTERAARLNWQPIRRFTFKNSRGAEIHNVLVVPPDFDETRKYPLVALVHGGPAGSWRDQFSTGWSNYHLVAALGYVVIGTDYTGSSGYGEAFARAILHDPAAGPAVEVTAAVDEASRRFPFIDGSRVCAAGASWGGFIVNWLQATTTRYRCLVNIIGAVNAESQWASTDLPYYRELIFGGPPWEGGKAWEQNPIRRAKDFKTPILISLNEDDYRAPFWQALEHWSVVQRLKLPGRLLIWPGEGHGLTRGENSRQFYGEMRTWLARWLDPARTPSAGSRREKGATSRVSSRSISGQRSFSLCDADHHRHRIERRLAESAVPVEPLGIVGDGVEENRAYAADGGGLERPQHRIAHESLAETAALKSAINGEPADDHDRDGIRHVPAHLASRRLVCDRTGSKAIKPDNASLSGNNVGPRRT